MVGTIRGVERAWRSIIAGGWLARLAAGNDAGRGQRLLEEWQPALHTSFMFMSATQSFPFICCSRLSVTLRPRP